jgi:AcrR family transcriptional regulator
VTTTGDHRTRPRRRGEALETAVLDAVLAELEAVGYAALTIESVRARARVGKASVYRRWPSKLDLVVDAVYRMLPDPAATPDTGSLRGDLLAAFRLVAGRLEGPAGAALRGVLGDAIVGGSAIDALRGRSRGRGVALLSEVVQRAGARGELDAAGIPLRRLEVGHALIRYEFLVTGALPDAVLVELVDDVMLPLLRAPAAR